MERSFLNDVSKAVMTTRRPVERHKTLKNILAALIMGGLFVAGGVSLVESLSFVARAKLTDGKIVSVQDAKSNGDTMYKLVVEFVSADGTVRQFSSKVSSSDPRGAVGGRVSVLYDPNVPTDARIKSIVDLYFLPLAFVGMGSLCVLVFFVHAIIAYRVRAREKRLRQTGRLVQATITGIQRALVKTERYSYYVIQGQWHDSSTNLIHFIESEFVPYDPSEFIKDRKDISVYINPLNADDYWVDISFLPAVR